MNNLTMLIFTYVAVVGILTIVMIYRFKYLKLWPAIVVVYFWPLSLIVALVTMLKGTVEAILLEELR